MNRKIRLALVIVCLPLFVAVSRARTAEFPLWIELRDGSILQIVVEDQLIDWLSVAKDGSTSTRSIQLSEAKQLHLTLEPASQHVSRIRTLIDQLSSEQPAVRKESEELLIAEGGPFVELIMIAATEAEHAAQQGRNDLEFRYRIQRILKKLRSTETKEIELDQLITNSGQLEGDVRDWALQGVIGTTSVQLDRSNIISIYRENPLVEQQRRSLKSDPVAINRFYEVGDDFFQTDRQVEVTFDVDAEGKSPKQKTVVHELFSFLGCRIACERTDWDVVISGFKFAGSRSKRNSIGNHYEDPVTRKTYRYQGNMEFTFCQPGRPHVPATVTEFGCFLEIVHPRHTVIEAYNTSGHRVAMVEVSAKRSSFVGIRSNDPIARVRILPNKYLNLDKIEDEDLNEDFAVDDIVFSKPYVSDELNSNNKVQLVLKTGERISCDGIKFDGEQVIVVDSRFSENLSYSQNDLTSILGPYQKPEYTREGDFYVMLENGSVVKAEVDGDAFALTAFDNLTRSIDQLRGFWRGSQCMYPESGDWENTQAILVYPTCRFQAAKYSADGLKLSFDSSDLTRLQQNSDDNSGAPEPQVDWEAEGLEIGPQEAPSVWFKQPDVIDQSRGFVRLQDGQMFVLGDAEDSFQLVGADDQEITLEMAGKRATFSVNDLAAIVFPKNN